ncbi:MAG: tetratricopeptide repeat protein [Lewinellaceae bacterium]|nr:tetratricopeptide repeat protein [Lewinellaceae bacterium]
MNVNNLGMAYFYSGQYEKSEPFLLQAMDILKKTLGGKHLDCLEGLNNLAGLYWALGKLDTAQFYMSEAIETHKKMLVKASGHLSEKNYPLSLSSSVKRWTSAFLS